MINGYVLFFVFYATGDILLYKFYSIFILFIIILIIFIIITSIVVSSASRLQLMFTLW